MNRTAIWTLACVLLLALGGCVAPALEGHASPGATAVSETPTAAAERPTPLPVETASGLADVVSVEVSGDSGSYRFRVRVLSPDTGCDQYANWWEVVSEDGELIYRRVVLHSHVGEQPFERAGSPVPVAADQVVYVRAHLHPKGYGGIAFKGSARAGFVPVDLPADFAAGLADVKPLPQGCAY